MKKKLFLRLCLILMVAFTISSCRTDQFPESETFDNSAKFQLTSKRISLNEAKHKEKLITELSKVETKFKTISKANVNGRVIDYGNGVSIDTDDVIYTENGPNYHNYTFYIKRENAPADAPLENLVLTPMTNGLYKELLISYNLTAQEKQTMVNGGFVDTKGKVTIIELAQGTYNNGSLTSRSSCGWDYSLQYTICDGNDHHSNGELPSSEGGPCRANNPSIPVLVAVYKCYEIEYNGPNGNDWWAGPGGGNGGGGGSQEPGGNDPNTNPCNGNGATTSPTDPNTNIGEGGCSGIPAPINLPSPGADPCRKAKASITAANDVLKNTNVQTKMDAELKGKISASIEWGVAIGQTSGGYEVTNSVPGTATSVTPPVNQLPSVATPVATGHSHAGGPANPSAGDFYSLLERMVDYNYTIKYSFVYGKSNGIDETYSLIIDDVTVAKAFLDTYPRAQNYDPVTHDFIKNNALWREIDKMKTIYNNKSTATDTSGETYNPPSVGIAYMLESLNAGMSIAKVDANGNLKRINATTEKIGNDERAKVSKCP